MPKKTKREKILAQARRIIQEQSSTQSVSPAPAPEPKAQIQHNPYSFKPATIATSSPTVSLTDQKEFSAIRQDLVKTVLLVFAAVIIELLFYWGFRGK